MLTLALRLLGPPRVESDASLISLRRRKSLALLACLAVEDQYCSRDSLTDLLGGRLGRESAFAGFRQCLYEVRSAIGEQWIQVERDRVALPASPGLWIDVREFHRLLGEAASAERSGDGAVCVDRLAAAEALLRGEFLSGFYLRDNLGFETWQRDQEERLRQERVGVLARLVGLHEERGELKQAVRYCRTWLTAAPLEEAVHRRLMLLHALDGEKAAALKQYERCRDVLKVELQQDPEAETEKLRERVMQGRISPSPAPARSSAAAPAPTDPTVRLPGSQAPGVTVLADPRGAVPSSCPSVEAAVIAVVENRDAPHTRVAIHQGALPERAALLLELAHPGQVLLTGATAQRLGPTVPRGASLRSLGEHRLKDLGPSVEIFQLLHPGLPAEHPPLSSLDSRPNNLRSQPTTFLGRRNELAAVVEALGREDVRLLTLTGAGGSGKTRIALQAAAAMVDRFEHGAYFVDLAPLNEATGIMPAIASVLGVQDAESVGRFLKRRELLLVLDNFEHLLPGAGEVSKLLEVAHRLKVLATSTEALRLRLESEFQVPALSLPAPGTPAGSLRQSEAVLLFEQRAASVSPGFSITDENALAVAKVCVRLDGLPLAIELAAARVKVLPPAALLESLDKGLSALGPGPRDLPSRQQTLLAEIEWSHRLLDEPSKACLRRLAVFDGGCTLEAAQAVCDRFAHQGDQPALSLLPALVDKNLVRMEQVDSEPRFTLLRTIRDFARDRLRDSGEAREAQGACADYFLALAERAEPKLLGPDEEAWIRRLDRERDNVRSALDWFRDHDSLKGLRHAAALGSYMQHGSWMGLGKGWLETFWKLFPDGEPPLELSKLCRSLGMMRFLTGTRGQPGPEVDQCWSAGLSHALASGDLRLIAQLQVLAAWSAPGLSNESRALREEEGVQTARSSGDQWTLAWCLLMTKVSGIFSGQDMPTRRVGMDEGLAIARRLGNPTLLCGLTSGLGRMLGWAGMYKEAELFLLEALAIAEKRGMRGIVLIERYGDLAGTFFKTGRLELAEKYVIRGLEIVADEKWAPHTLRHDLDILSRVERSRGNQRRAVRLAAAAVACSDHELKEWRDLDTALINSLQPLDEGVLEEEWPVGSAMTREEAIAYALGDAQRP